MQDLDNVNLNEEEEEQKKEEPVEINEEQETKETVEEYPKFSNFGKGSPKYRPQRTQSQRTIKITNVEERKGRLSKYHVYVIECDPPPTGVVNVPRRYNDFKWLRQRLGIEFQGLWVPPLPPSQLFGRFDEEFVEERRQDLERFLNRMESIKPFSESPTFQFFLSRPESTFTEGQKEIKINFNKDYNEISNELNKLYPDLIDYDLPDNVHEEDVPRLKEFLSKVEQQMSLLSKSGAKLYNHLSNVSKEMTQFSEAFDDLYQAESNYPYKTNQERFDVRKQFTEWTIFHSKQTDAYYDNFFRQLRYEHEDIKAFLELFKRKEKLDFELKKCQNRIEKIETQEASGKELKPKEQENKEIDIKLRKSLQQLQSISTKIILRDEIAMLWNNKTQQWKANVKNFAKMQADLTHKMLAGWQNVETNEDLNKK